MRRGFLYLLAIMDWASRKVLAWRLSNTMDAELCCRARRGHRSLRQARHLQYRQASQFTSFAFTTTLRDAGIRISMDDRGRWMDNLFIERLWRSLKYECVFLNAFETGSEARMGIGRWIGYYNADRPHSALAGRTPNELYATQVALTGNQASVYRSVRGPISGSYSGIIKQVPFFIHVHFDGSYTVQEECLRAARGQASHEMTPET